MGTQIYRPNGRTKSFFLRSIMGMKDPCMCAGRKLLVTWLCADNYTLKPVNNEAYLFVEKTIPNINVIQNRIKSSAEFCKQITRIFLSNMGNLMNK